MSTRYIQEDKSHHEKQAEIESLEEIIHDSGCEEEQTTLIIMIQIIKISLPIILTFISLSLLATFMFYLLSFETLQMTEGYSLTLLYFNCVVVGIFWGGTFGYQVLGSHALGKKRFEKISEYHYQVLVVSGLLGIIIAIVSVFIVPNLLELLHPDPVALEYLRSLMKSFAPAIVLFALFQTYMRLANIMHDTNICFYSSVVGCVIQAIVSYILFNKVGLGIHSIGIGYTVNFLYCYLFFYIYYKKFNSDGIIKPFVLSFLKVKGIIKQMKFGAFPLINYLLFLISIEAISFFGFMVNDVTFTVLTVLMNILSVIVVISEAISCAMSALVAYNIGKGRFNMPYKVLYAGFIISVIVQVFLLGGLNMFPETILSVFSKDDDFLAVAYSGIRIFSVAISLNSFHFLLCEFIIVYGNHSFPFYTLIIGKYIVQLSFAFILTPLYGLQGIIMSMIIGQLVCLIIFAFYIYTYVEFKEGCENNDNIITSEDLEESLILKKNELQELNSHIKNDIEVKEVK